MNFKQFFENVRDIVRINRGKTMTKPNNTATTATTSVHSVVLTQRERAEAERKWWDELKRMAADDDVVGFYRQYATYLEWNNVISPSRQTIHRMAIRAAELLS